MTHQKRTRPNSKAEILDAAVSVATREGLRNFSREQVAKEAKVAEATVSYHFENMDELRCEVVKVATERKLTSILDDVRADRNRAELYKRLSPDQRQKIAAIVAR